MEPKAYYDGNVFVPFENRVERVDSADSAEKPYMRFFGTLSQEDYKELSLILKDTERVDLDEW